MMVLDREAAARAVLHGHCARCEIGGWHPEARHCSSPNCELRPRGAAETDAGVPVPLAPASDFLIPVHASENAS